MGEKCILVCKEFLQALSGISEKDKDSINYEEILNILNCIKLDYDCHLKIRFPHFIGHGDKSWFYCYEGDRDTYVEEYNKSVNKVDDFFICYMYDETYNIFNHLIIEPTFMGAWQAYLMSIATHFLPTAWHGGYSRRKMVFSSDEAYAIINKITYRKPENVPTLGDLRPHVSFEGNKATVKSCYWNQWSGLVQETVEIRFIDNRAYFLDSVQHERLVKYDCGIRY